MTRLLHKFSRLLSSLAEWLWDLGGSLEVWCDERLAAPKKSA
jgi:hypothetical protein